MGGGRGGIMISPEGEGKIALQLAPHALSHTKAAPTCNIYFWGNNCVAV